MVIASMFLLLSLYPAECPTVQLMDSMISKGSVYVGEIHGTDEAPEFVACLLDRALEVRDPVVLSLELPARAEDRNSDFWAGEDGRSSHAMRRLLDHALVIKGEGRLSIHYQEDRAGDIRQLDARIGESLAGLSKSNTVIALSGNIHAMKYIPERMGLSKALPLPAGSYLGENFTHVRLGAEGGGSVWGCMNGDCGRHDVPGSKSGHRAGAIIDGHDFGYDFIYFVKKYTASPPYADGVKPVGP